jgi:hypothetical protein
MKDRLIEELRFTIRRAEIRGILRYFKSRRRTIDYVALAKALGMFSGGSELAQILGKLQEEDDAEGQGFLSSLVVGKNTGVPGSGYFENAREVLGRDIARDEGAEREFWAGEIEKLGLPRPGFGSVAQLKQLARRIHEELAPLLVEAQAIAGEAISNKNFDVADPAMLLENLITSCINHCESVYARPSAA